MAEKRIGIEAECVCDLPRSVLRRYDIDTIYFLIETDTGVFTDTDEITAENIFESMADDGSKTSSSCPPVEVYKDAFVKKLAGYDEIILPTISSKISDSYAIATKAADELGENGRKIHIFDTGHLSTGLGHFVMKAAEMAESGCSSGEILSCLTVMRQTVSTTFMAENADFLCKSGHVTENVRKICGMLNIHPVLVMKNGFIKLKALKFGRYERACSRYIKSELSDLRSIDKKRAFLTLSGCSVKMTERLRKEILEVCPFDELIITKASATISCNCGTNTFGILFIRNEGQVL